MADHLTLLHNTWYAELRVPADVRRILGRSVFRQTLKTTDKRIAKQRVLSVVAGWKAEIAKARGMTDPLDVAAFVWRRDLAAANEDHAEAVELALTDYVEREHEEGRITADEARSLVAVATGKRSPLAGFIPAWEASIRDNVTPKAFDMMVADVKRFTKRFPTLQDVEQRTVRMWFGELLAEGLTAKTASRILSALRNFWRYVQHVEGLTHDPFTDAIPPQSGKKKQAQNRSYDPWTPAEVVALWRAAVVKKDTVLADLITVAAFTGLRIEEACQLQVQDIVPGVSLSLRDSKTKAGIRTVPIHPRLSPVLDRLCKDAQDGYLIHSSAGSKHGIRSAPLSKRFGHLKTKLGFTSDRKTFHSLRASVATFLDHAGVPEGIAADILGHQKQTMTYGLYSGGSSFEQKKEAVEKLAYSEWTETLA